MTRLFPLKFSVTSMLPSRRRTDGFGVVGAVAPDAGGGELGCLRGVVDSPGEDGAVARCGVGVGSCGKNHLEKGFGKARGGNSVAQAAAERARYFLVVRVDRCARDGGEVAAELGEDGGVEARDEDVALQGVTVDEAPHGEAEGCGEGAFVLEFLVVVEAAPGEFGGVVEGSAWLCFVAAAEPVANWGFSQVGQREQVDGRRDTGSL